MHMNRSAQWQRLAEILDRIDKHGLRGLSSSELLEFGRLYRRAASELSFARTHGLDPSLTQYLNQLVGRAYGHVYIAEKKSSPKISSFFFNDFPATVRALWPYIAVATATSVAAGIFAFALVWSRLDTAWVILPTEFKELIEHLVERHCVPQDWMPFSMRSLMSSAIMTNNIGVAFLAFASGIFLGLGTLFMLILNGLMLGAAAAGIAQQCGSLNFWAFVAPHGVIELPAIFISAGAGLVLGYALINPGYYDRKTALKLAARQALALVLGVVAMLVVAGIIEAFFSPTLLPEPLKFLFALGVAFLLIGYLFVMPLKPPAARD
jgi:uncharacterized membrane protein SpoIIM required for sporulation